MSESTTPTAPVWLFAGLFGALIGVGIFSIVDGRAPVGFGAIAVAFALVPIALNARASATAKD